MQKDEDDAKHDFGPVTLKQAENLANFVYEHNRQRLYAEIGRGVVARALYVFGAACIALAGWLSTHSSFTWK